MLFEIAGKAVERARVATTSPVMTIPAKGRMRGEAVVLHKTAPLRFRSLRRFDRHSNYQELLNIVSSLAELGFRVTVVDRECPTGDLPRKKFDVVMGLAAGNSGLRLPELYERSPSSLKIGYCAGPEPGWSNNAIQKRYEHAFSSRGMKVPNQKLRLVDPTLRDVAIALSDLLLVHGNQHTSSTYHSAFPDKFCVQVPGIALSCAPRFDTRKRNEISFLSVGGNGAIVKGIDLVVDLSVEFEDLRFGYCGPLESDFLSLFGTRFAAGPKWFHYGFVHARSLMFSRIAQEYSFGILPSCSEGMATSVLTMMAHGLIPVVTDECGIDVEGFGFKVRVNESLGSTIKDLREISSDELAWRQERSFQIGRSYSSSRHRLIISETLKSFLGV